MTTDAFLVNVNKSNVPSIVPEQSESAYFVTLVEIHNVDVAAASNRYAAVFLQWPSADKNLVFGIVYIPPEVTLIGYFNARCGNLLDFVRFDDPIMEVLFL